MLVNFFVVASETTTMTMTQFLSTGTEVASWLGDQVGNFSGIVMSNPMIAVPFYIFIAGAAVGMLGRLFHL